MGGNVFFSFVASLVICMALIPVLAASAGRLRFIDLPNDRKVHVTPTAKIGGLAFATGTFVATLLWAPHDPVVISSLVGAIVILLFGAWDDRAELPCLSSEISRPSAGGGHRHLVRRRRDRSLAAAAGRRDAGMDQRADLAGIHRGGDERHQFGGRTRWSRRRINVAEFYRHGLPSLPRRRPHCALDDGFHTRRTAGIPPVQHLSRQGVLWVMPAASFLVFIWPSPPSC